MFNHISKINGGTKMPVKKYKLNIEPDFPDSRDWLYRPNLQELEPYIDPKHNLKIRNQGREGSCTGFALAAAVDHIKMSSSDPTFRASTRMLYEMAKLNDEWPKENYEGSSLRGAIHGWKNSGVCSEEQWPYFTTAAKKGSLTVDIAKAARSNTIGAYYRIRPAITDFHAALNEIGVIVCSAKVHTGWNKPVDDRIKYTTNQAKTGGHAFAIVGYTHNGFWVQNSWGKNWGDNGLALWSYEDWIENVMDAWVFRLSLSTPQIFGKRPQSSKLINHNKSAKAGKPKVKRGDIAGHFVHIDDGRFAKPDRYWSDANDVKITSKRLATSTKYDHLLIYGHGGLNSPADSARRIFAMKDTFKKNRIYPYHVMYDTGIVEELKDLIFHKGKRSNEMAGGFFDWVDTVLEHLLSRPGTLLWKEMKRDAQLAFAKKFAGHQVFNSFLSELKKTPIGRRKKIHIVGHSTGAILFAHMLKTFSNHNIKIETVSLLAPACREDLYLRTYQPILENRKRLKIKKMFIYNLKDKLEKDDHVARVYRKSLLYLVANAFETFNKKEDPRAPLLGMEKTSRNIIQPNGKPSIYYSNGVSGNKTRSRSHGGFDNDPVTMNHILRNILGKRPSAKFTDENLKY